ncbi:MAG: aldehyde dehydrogenase family protein [Phycisphaeraceae bacterium]
MTTATTRRLTLASYDPANGQQLGEVEITPVDQITSIVASARRAQEDWGAHHLDARADALRPLADRLRDRRDEAANLITAEMGKTLREAQGEIDAITEGLNAELRSITQALQPEHFESDGIRSIQHQDPLGVVAAITPWNYPMMMPHWLLIPALVAGNAVILKPSEETPLCGAFYASLFDELLPANVLQTVQGADDQGKALVEADIDLIAFTGSRETGRKVLAAAAQGIKRAILELGSKDPLIVLDDANIDDAVAFAARSSFANAGQACVSTERIYVHHTIYDTFLNKLVSAAVATHAGDGRNPDHTLGPMVNARQRDHVLAQIADAKARGARVLQGVTTHGNTLQPVVIADFTHEMDLARIETFGPVAAVRSFSDDEQAIQLANDSDLGLGAAVFGEPEHAETIAARLKVGMVGINKSVGSAHGCPWVGARQSSYGFHSSREGHRQFAQTRVVSRLI